MPVVTPQRSQALIARLKQAPSDNPATEKTTMLRERAEAAEMIHALQQQLISARSTCEKAMACMQRWEGGNPYCAAGPEAAIKQELYDVIRPGARESIKALGKLIPGGARPA